MKFNPYHDRLGRFTTSGGYSIFSANPKTKTGMAAIKREQKNNPLIGAAYGTKRSKGQIEQAKRDKASQRKAKELLASYDVKENQKELIEDIKNLYRYADRTGHIRIKEAGNIGIKKDAMKKVKEIARKAADNVRLTDNSTKAEYDEIRSRIKNTKIKISDQDKSNIADFNDYRRSTFGNVTISNKGIELDSFYNELSSAYPHLFDARRNTNPADQLQSLNDVLDNLRPRSFRMDKELTEVFVDNFANDIVIGYITKQSA